MGRFLDALQALIGEKPAGQVIAQIIPTWQAARPIPTKINYPAYVREGYKGNSVIFSCIREIVGSASEPVWIMDRGEDTEKIRNADILTLLRRPNPEQDGVSFLAEGLTHQHIWGDWYINKVRSRRKNVVQMWNLRPDRVEIKRATDGTIDYYAYYEPSNVEEVGGRIGPPREVDPNDVIHIKWEEDPESDNYGLSPITILARYGDLDLAAVDYLRAFFSNGGIPAGIIKLQNRVQKEERERIKTMFREEYGAMRGAANHMLGTMVLDATVEYEQIASPVEKLKIQPLFDVTEARICSVFNVPPILVGVLVGLEHSTYSNYKEARSSLWEETLAPIYRKMGTAFTMGLVPEFHLPDGTRILPDLSRVAAMQDDQFLVSTKVVAEWNAGLIKRNEARTKLGYAELDDKKLGDEFKAAPAPALPPAPAHVAVPIDANPKLPVGKPQKQLPPAPRAKEEQSREQQWSSFVRRAEPLELAVMRDVANVISAAASDALAELRRQSVPSAHLADVVPEPEHFKMQLVKVAERHMPAMVRSGWQFGVDQMSEAYSKRFALPSTLVNIAFDLLVPGVADYIAERPYLYAALVAQTVVDDMRDQINEGVQQGETIDQIAQRIETYENVGSMQRAKVTARTEVISAMNKGAIESYKASRVVPLKRWLTARDDRVRGLKPRDAFNHVEADGQTVPLDAHFDVSGEQLLYPGDPAGSPGNIIQCRCTVIPVFEQAQHAWDPDKHPRAPKGKIEGGQFVSSDPDIDAVTDVIDAVRAPRAQGTELISKEAERLSGEKNLNAAARVAIKQQIVKDLAAKLKESDLTEDEIKAFLDAGFADAHHGHGLYQDAIASVLDQWAATSGDHNPEAIALQLRAREVFGLDDFQPPHWLQADGYGQTGILDSAEKLADEHKRVIDRILKTVYDHTQEKLKAANISSMVLYRGMGIKKADYAAPLGELHTGTVRLQPLSSFSSSHSEAQFFAGQSDVHVVSAMRVDRKNVFSTAITGPGCANELEFIVLGRKKGYTVAHAGVAYEDDTKNWFKNIVTKTADEMDE